VYPEGSVPALKDFDGYGDGVNAEAAVRDEGEFDRDHRDDQGSDEEDGSSGEEDDEPLLARKAAASATREAVPAAEETNLRHSAISGADAQQQAEPFFDDDAIARSNFFEDNDYGDYGAYEGAGAEDAAHDEEAEGGEDAATGEETEAADLGAMQNLMPSLMQQLAQGKQVMLLRPLMPVKRKTAPRMSPRTLRQKKGGTLASSQ
jgi:hypothetical protein